MKIKQYKQYVHTYIKRKNIDLKKESKLIFWRYGSPNWYGGYE